MVSHKVFNKKDLVHPQSNVSSNVSVCFYNQYTTFQVATIYHVTRLATFRYSRRLLLRVGSGVFVAQFTFTGIHAAQPSRLFSIHLHTTNNDDKAR